jgi:hypothetical protein
MHGPDAQKTLETGAATLVFTAIFLFGRRFYPMHIVTRDRRNVLSVSAGVSLAYVFVHLMPELAGARLTFVKSTSIPTQFNGMVVYFLALVGFLVFFSLDHFSKTARAEAAEGDVPDFSVKVAGFAGYVCLVAYLLVNNLDNSALASTAYAVAMGVHFLTFDHGFREEPGTGYERRGHLLLAAAAPVGWALGLMFALPQAILALMLGFLSGGVIVNSMITELPSNKDGKLIPFLFGSVAYSAILIQLG